MPRMVSCATSSSLSHCSNITNSSNSSCIYHCYKVFLFLLLFLLLFTSLCCCQLQLFQVNARISYLPPMNADLAGAALRVYSTRLVVMIHRQIGILEPIQCSLAIVPYFCLWITGNCNLE